MVDGYRRASLRGKDESRGATNRMHLSKVTRYAAAAMFLGLAASAAALEPSTLLANYGRQSWAMENGLPQNTVQALAQTKDGFLWLGTEAGLVRFDGVEFQTYDRNSVPALPGNDVRCLLATWDGALWIGTGAGLARWKDGASRTFTRQDGLPDNGIQTIEEAQDGNLLVWTEQGPARLSGDRFVPATNVDGSTRGSLTSPGVNPGATIFEAQMSDGVQVQGDRSVPEDHAGQETRRDADPAGGRQRDSRQPDSGCLRRSRKRAVDRDQCGVGAVGERARWIASRLPTLWLRRRS